MPLSENYGAPYASHAWSLAFFETAVRDRSINCPLVTGAYKVCGVLTDPSFERRRWPLARLGYLDGPF